MKPEEKVDERKVEPFEVILPEKKAKKGKIIWAVLALFFILGSIPATVYLVQQTQEIRKKAAAGCSGCHCTGEGSCPAGCGTAHIPNSGCASGWAECCKEPPPPPDTGPAPGGGCGGENQPCCDQDTTPNAPPYAHGCNSSLHCLNSAGQQAAWNEIGTCKARPSGGDEKCNTCRGSCDKGGCTCSSGSIDCKTGCNMWPGCAYCRGRSSICADTHASYYYGTSGSLSYDQKYWCSTVQCDSNCANGACIVVFIGDRGEWCVSGASNVCRDNTGKCSFSEDRNRDGKVDENDLDWDCGPSACKGECLETKTYDENWNKIADLSTLTIDQSVYFAVRGTTNCPSGINKGRFRINGDVWQETEKINASGEYYISYTIPSAGSYTVEAMVYCPDIGWK